MLELKDIVKDYVNGNNVTHALKGISVNFRKNEFVSILGASGCGKTTTLNIIGGLDRYTSGDLLINGKSTKNYTDRDWDTYRNHSIGFIFQTYNLISHQNILHNVELALTISGVSKEERRARALEALKKVGLEGMEKKKPNQLSGGQCQRVAIARALINNPEILLADEPTGALDSETSIQIMDLLKEVASDRLVIMVTHNPDLAYKYSTRIVKMSDGQLVEDSNPFDGKEERVVETFKGKKKKTSMSLKTSTGLSLSNLGSKMRRTVLVTIAGSIGIIGVSAVLGVSKGVKNYINNMQNDMLSAYPLRISEETADYSSLMNGLNTTEAIEKFEFDPENPKIGVDSMIDYLMTAYEDVTKVKTNTIDENLMSYINSVPRELAPARIDDYSIDVTNNIFTKWNKNGTEIVDYSLNGLIQSYIAELNTVDNFEDYAKFVNLFTNYMKQIPDNTDYLLDQYDVIAKTEDSFLNNPNHEIRDDELVLVVDKNTTLTDLTLAEIGVFGHDEFLHIAQKAIAEQTVRKDETLTPEQKQEKLDDINRPDNEKYTYRKDFEYSELVGREFEYFPQNKIFSYGEILSEELQVRLTGIDMTSLSMISLAFDIDNDLFKGTLTSIDNFMNPTKLTFRRTTAEPGDDVEGIDRTLGSWSFNDGTSTYSFTISDLTSPAVVVLKDGEAIPYINIVGATTSPAVYPLPLSTEGWHYSGLKDSAWGEGKKLKISSILRLNDQNNFGSLERGIYYSKPFADLFISDSNKEGESPLTTAMKNNIKNDNSALEAYVTFTYKNHRKDDSVEPILSYASCLNGDMSASIGALFGNLMGGGGGFDTDKTHLRSISGLKVEKVDGNYNFSLVPKSISLYPKSFDAKEQVKEYLDKWNQEGDLTFTVNGVEKTLSGNRDELTVTDTIEMIITLINTLINAITISLVVFTSLSLVVSCFMIAVITYISVVERIKEIGIIRSLGGRKRDVASLFIMETLLTGLFSGLFGIGITYVLQIILNAVLQVEFGVAIMKLTIGTAAIMVGVSVALSVLSGLIPSQSAAHKDPVVALRTGE